VSETISAIASLLWPLIVLAVLVVFRGPLAKVIRSSESRDFTIRIGGQEVSVGELHRQQVDMISDLQDQIANLQSEVAPADQRTPAKTPGTVATVPVDSPVTVSARTASANTVPPATPPDYDETDTELTHVLPAQERPQFLHDPVMKAPWERLEVHQHDLGPVDNKPEPGMPPLTVVPSSGIDHELVPRWATEAPDTRPKPAGVLWVDDQPSHNALLVDRLERQGVVVDTARSTKEALQKLTGQRYQLIVSDMERVESGKPMPNAGLELIRTVRTFDRDTPVVIYGRGGGRAMEDTATQIGADLVTSSWYQLNREMHRIGVLEQQ
jgi:CheY-like chemotaxis protein